MKSRLEQEGVGLSGSADFGQWVCENHETLAVLYFRFFTDTLQKQYEEDEDSAGAVAPLDDFFFMLWAERDKGNDLVTAYEKHKQEQQGILSPQTRRFSNN